MFYMDFININFNLKYYNFIIYSNKINKIYLDKFIIN